MISYAQNFEDVMLNRIFGGRTTGFYIDVGAMDPIDGSVTKHFYDIGWSGINVEPDARFHRKLVEGRPRDINLDLALGERRQVKTLYEFDEQGISTFSERFRDYFSERGHRWTERPCELTTLSAICREFVQCPIDFLKLDAEGWEGPILRGNDWNAFRPAVLVIEATLPFSHSPFWHDWEPYLVDKCRYNFVYFDGLNRFYTRAEDGDFACFFAHPPNVLDGFQLYATARAEARVIELQRQLAERTASAESLRCQLEEAVRHATDLERRLVESRLWAGRLSELLAAFTRPA